MADPLDSVGLRAWLEAVEPGARSDPDRVRIVRAPGRVNLIGEHTDYNAGLVLPVAIDLEIRIAYLPTDDGHVRLTATRGSPVETFDLADLPPRSGRWIDYVAGVAWAMREAGLPTNGFTGVLASSLPVASGLASSAALELASAWALSGAGSPPAEGLALAQLAQRAENEYVGVACGLMDQFASACGRSGHAVRLDCQSLEWSAVPLPPGIDIVVCHTGVPRPLAETAFNERRAECERAVTALAAAAPEVRSLRDVEQALLERHAARLDPVALRRVRHVVTENLRVLATEAALEAGDRTALRDIFAASHASLRDGFEVSSPELDALVEIANATPGVIAARMTGGGFGGCTINLVEAGEGDRLAAAVAAEYPRRTGYGPQTWLVRAADGAGAVGPVA